jgi:SAM-dependent methyltransferase
VVGPIFESRPARRKGLPDDLREAILVCQGCAKRYPIVDGIPVILDANNGKAALTTAELFGLTAQPLAPEILAELAAPSSDDQLLPHQLENLGAYLDASWGDCATPLPDGPVPSFGFAELAGKVLSRLSVQVPRALELGCGTGRGLASLRRGAELVVGIDRNPAALRYANRILRGDEVTFPRRKIGRTYERATIRAGNHAAPDVQLICADVLAPPLAPGGFERVLALNLLDSISSPRALLHHVDQLAGHHGEILLATPYAWRSGVMADDERLEGSDPAVALRAELVKLGWTIEEEQERVPWILRRDARSATLFDVHWVRARSS